MKNMIRMVLVFAGAMVAVSGRGSDSGAIYSIMAPAQVQAGAAVEVRVAIMNPTATDLTVELPERVDARLVARDTETGATLPGEATGGVGDVRVPAGGFVVRAYRIRVPADAANGLTALQVSSWGNAAVEIGGRVAAAPVSGKDAAATDSSAARRPPTNLGRAPAGSGLRRTFADRLAPHEPIYFIYGPDAPAAKFQVSFKYKLLDFRDLTPQRMTRTLHVAYTQRSLWDLDGVSSPFYDTSYMPELMYESLAPRPEDSERWFTWLGVQAAFKHESNGRDGPVSRSLNMLYARPVFAFGDLDGWHLLAMPEVFAYVGTLEDNTEIEEYRGFGKLSLVLGRNDGPSLMTTLWAGNDFQHPTVQLDLTLPIRTRLLDFETYLIIQYFNGFGESLLSYDEESESVRAGISLVR